MSMFLGQHLQAGDLGRCAVRALREIPNLFTQLIRIQPVHFFGYCVANNIVKQIGLWLRGVCVASRKIEVGTSLRVSLDQHKDVAPRSGFRRNQTAVGREAAERLCDCSLQSPRKRFSGRVDVFVGSVAQRGRGLYFILHHVKRIVLTDGRLNKTPCFRPNLTFPLSPTQNLFGSGERGLTNFSHLYSDRLREPVFFGLFFFFVFSHRFIPYSTRFDDPSVVGLAAGVGA